MKLTILMYHKIDELPANGRHPGNYVTPRNFEAQLDALRSWGYQTIGFDAWVSPSTTRHALPAKPLIVTFDDGYTCFDRYAWPALRVRGMTATVFLVAGQIGGTNAWDAGGPQERLLDAGEILRLQADGVTFGSHSVTHRPLARIPGDHAFEELAGSRESLRELLGHDPEVFAYPFSNQSATVRALARRAGYKAAVRGKGRMNWPRTSPWGLKRIKIEPTTTVDDLARILFRERYLRLF